MTGPVLLQPPVQRWECPACGLTDTTRGFVGNRMHNCPRTGGMTVPLVPEGVRAKVAAVEREDYVGDDIGRVQLNENNRPIMAVVTTRDDGQDCTVYAPTATATGIANR